MNATIVTLAFLIAFFSVKLLSCIFPADKSIPLQLSYIRSNRMCTHLIKVRNLYPAKKYFINITIVGHDISEKDKQEYLEINTKPFYGG